MTMPTKLHLYRCHSHYNRENRINIIINLTISKNSVNAFIVDYEHISLEDTGRGKRC